VDAAHDLGRHQRARVPRGIGGARGSVEEARARRLVRHQPHESLAVAAGGQVVLGDAEVLEVALRQGDASGAGVSAHVAHDVGELQGLAEVHRVLPRARVGGAEDLDAAEPDGGAHCVAVRLEVLERLVAHAREVHLAAVDDGLECGAWNRIRGDRRLQLPGDRVDRHRARREATRDVLAPARQTRALGAGVAAEVGDVIDRTAEGVDRVQRLAPRSRQRQEGEVEVRAALARQARAEAAEAHARAALRAWPCATTQATASARAARGSVCGSPRSRTALAGLKYMRLRDMRTAVIGTAGGRPGTLATPPHAVALPQASAYGTLKRGARPPVIEASSRKISSSERFPRTWPRMYFSPGVPRSAGSTRARAAA